MNIDPHYIASLITEDPDDHWLLDFLRDEPVSPRQGELPDLAQLVAGKKDLVLLSAATLQHPTARELLQHAPPDYKLDKIVRPDGAEVYLFGKPKATIHVKNLFNAQNERADSAGGWRETPYEAEIIGKYLGYSDDDIADYLKRNYDFDRKALERAEIKRQSEADQVDASWRETRAKYETPKDWELESRYQRAMAEPTLAKYDTPRSKLADDFAAADADWEAARQALDARINSYMQESFDPEFPNFSKWADEEVTDISLYHMMGDLGHEDVDDEEKQLRRGMWKDADDVIVNMDVGYNKEELESIKYPEWLDRVPNNWFESRLREVLANLLE
jgi:hypothetical protein